VLEGNFLCCDRVLVYQSDVYGGGTATDGLNNLWYCNRWVKQFVVLQQMG